MIDFTQSEITDIDKFINVQSKRALITLFKIYDKYNGTTHQGCWCSRIERENKHKHFFNWYNENKKQENE